MSLPPPNIARQDESDEAAWAAQERALRGEPLQEVAAGGLLRLCCSVAAAGGMGIMLAWGVGELLSDRFWWSQFLDWIPTILMLPAVGVLLVLAELARRLMIRARPTERTNARLRRAICTGAAVWGLAVAYFVQADLGLTRAIGLRPHPAEGVRPTRILFWNCGAEELTGWTPNVTAAKPDLCIFTSISHDDQIIPLAEAMSEDPVNAPTWTLRQNRFTVLSRVRILRAGFTTLNISRGAGLDPREQGPNRYHDPGRAMFVEIDASLFASAPGAATASAPAKPIVVWVVDLPSDLSIPKELVTMQASEAIAAFHGPVLAPDSMGRWIAQEAGPQDSRGFPAPDVIVGDFNIPRGSRSLRNITAMHEPALHNAWSHAGYGYTATYPRHRPLWHIDQIFIGERFKATEFETLGTGTGTHKAVWADVVGK